MWEYSIKLSKNNKSIAEFVFSTLKQKTEKYKSIVALSDDENFYNVSLAIEEKHSEFAQEVFAKIIAKIICSIFKEEFLNRYLSLPSQDKITLTAFKNALINFDKETDYFIISKNLILEGELYLESFYNFKLSRLQEKWGELVRLANENRDYLVCKDAFFDLLKFLIDNIDVSKREIEIFEDKNGYRILSLKENDLEEYENQVFSCEAMISSIIELSPRKIELYCSKENDATNLIKTIYEKRVNLHSSTNNMSNIEFVTKNLQI